jgi:hypothetical protein
MNESASLNIQAHQTWADMVAWLSGHSLNIILGFAAGIIIVALLLGVKWLGMRLCRKDPDRLPRGWWPTTLWRRRRSLRPSKCCSSSPRRCRRPYGRASWSWG